MLNVQTHRNRALETSSSFQTLTASSALREMADLFKQGVDAERYKAQQDREFGELRFDFLKAVQRLEVGAVSQAAA